MFRLFRWPPLVAFVIATLIIIVLLALGIPFVIIPNAVFLLGALAALAIAEIAVEYDHVLDESEHVKSSCGQSRFCLRCWLLRLGILFGLLLLFYVIALSFFLLGNILVLGLLALWVLLFLTLTVIFILL